MSTIFGTIDAAKAGLITFMPEGKGEEQLDAASADVIPQGSVIWRDVANATPADRVWKLPGTSGAELGGTWGVATKAKAAGTTKVTGVWGAGFEVTVMADGAITPDAIVGPSGSTAGQVIQFVSPVIEAGIPKVGQGFARYLRRYKYANDGDGNHAKVAAANDDIIVIKLL